MDAIDAVLAAGEGGAVLSRNGAHLRIQGVRGLRPEVRDSLRCHKAEVLNLIDLEVLTRRLEAGGALLWDLEQRQLTRSSEYRRALPFFKKLLRVYILAHAWDARRQATAAVSA